MIQNIALQYPGGASYTSNGKQMLKLKLAGISGDCLDEKGRDSEQQSYSSICAAHTERYQDKHTTYSVGLVHQNR